MFEIVFQLEGGPHKKIHFLLTEKDSDLSKMGLNMLKINNLRERFETKRGTKKFNKYYNAQHTNSTNIFKKITSKTVKAISLLAVGTKLIVNIKIVDRSSSFIPPTIILNASIQLYLQYKNESRFHLGKLLCLYLRDHSRADYAMNAKVKLC